MNQLAIQQEPGNIQTIDPNAAIFDSEKFNQITLFSKMMSSGRCTVPDHLKNNQGDCLAVTMQAAQWGMNPFAVAQKTCLINGTLAYEAQLVNAVVSSSNAIKGRFHYEYGGEWEQISGKKAKRKKNQNDKWVTEKGWEDKDEVGLFIRVGAIIAGESTITWGEPVYLAAVDIRNSPLWATHPKQQIAYLAVKMWCRMFTPDVILGVYTPEEIDTTPVVKDITPTSAADTLNNALNLPGAYTLDQFKADLANTSTLDELKAVAGKAISLPTNDHTEANKLYKARGNELKSAQQQQQQPQGPTKAELLADVAKATMDDEFAIIEDAANSLSEADRKEVIAALKERIG